MALAEVIPRVLETAQRLRETGRGNETNTRIHLIDPVLRALGWDPADFDQVDREVATRGGTVLDYSLKIGGAPRLYVEAKSLGKDIGDERFVSQTLNYANNDGVVWCVLTNGLRWRVYKTNESVPLERKLGFEVDLADADQSPNDMARRLSLIGRTAVSDGQLDQFGDRVFTDARVRTALQEMARQPPDAMLHALEHHIGHPGIAPDALVRSLQRVLGSPTPAGGATAGVGAQRPSDSVVRSARTEATGADSPSLPRAGQEWDLSRHLGDKGTLITELFQALDTYGMALGPDAIRRVRKQAVNYFRGRKAMFSLKLQQQRIIVYLALQPASVSSWDSDTMRDVSNIGHWGNGDVEYSLSSSDQVPLVRELIKAAYDRAA